MKIGITGTTAGIGNAVCRLPYEFVEFNRIDGDIHDVEAVYEKLNLKTTKCKSYLVNPGVTDTNLTADQNRKKMTVQEVADMIKFVLDNKLYVPEIYFYVE